MSKEQKTAKTYAEKLRDPRWQKKRLEVMERDKFACRRCGDATSTLNVHHVCYLKRTEPWDYEIRFLATLCENCHAAVEDPEIKRFMGFLATTSLDRHVLLRVAASIHNSGEVKNLEPCRTQRESLLRARDAILGALLMLEAEIRGYK